MSGQVPGYRDAPRATCPLCGRNVLINKDGVFRSHNRKAHQPLAGNSRARHCPGSRKRVPDAVQALR